MNFGALLSDAAKRAAIFIFLSSAILLIGQLLCFLGHVCSRKRVCTFASGIAFILSGMLKITSMNNVSNKGQKENKDYLLEIFYKICRLGFVYVIMKI